MQISTEAYKGVHTCTVEHSNHDDDENRDDLFLCVKKSAAVDFNSYVLMQKKVRKIF